MIGSEGSEINVVEEFPSLGSIIADNGKIDADAERRITQASRAFGALRKAVSVPGQEPEAADKEEGLRGMCSLCCFVRLRMLGPSQKEYEEVEFIPSQVH